MADCDCGDCDIDCGCCDDDCDCDCCDCNDNVNCFNFFLCCQVTSSNPVVQHNAAPKPVVPYEPVVIQPQNSAPQGRYVSHAKTLETLDDTSATPNTGPSISPPPNYEEAMKNYQET
ncbi:hypothetical protein FQA39_LY03398 [Lamprigera yunnana]|nr:hypothetical protein FQA39_LY03398 [Lamprigera yunnana]